MGCGTLREEITYVVEPLVLAQPAKKRTQLPEEGDPIRLRAPDELTAGVWQRLVLGVGVLDVGEVLRDPVQLLVCDVVQLARTRHRGHRREVTIHVSLKHGRPQCVAFEHRLAKACTRSSIFPICLMLPNQPAHQSPILNRNLSQQGRQSELQRFFGARHLSDVGCAQRGESFAHAGDQNFRRGCACGDADLAYIL